MGTYSALDTTRYSLILVNAPLTSPPSLFGSASTPTSYRLTHLLLRYWLRVDSLGSSSSSSPGPHPTRYAHTVPTRAVPSHHRMTPSATFVPFAIPVTLNHSAHPVLLRTPGVLRYSSHFSLGRSPRHSTGRSSTLPQPLLATRAVLTLQASFRSFS